MPAKTINLPDIGQIQLQRKRGMKSIRLRVNHEGQVILSMPKWVPSRQAISFASSKKDWIISEKSKIKRPAIDDGTTLANGTQIKIIYSDRSRPFSKTTGKNTVMYLPKNYDHAKSQHFVHRKINELLINEAEKTLLPRLSILAENHNINYKSASVAILRSRWGSCDNKTNIKLNAYLLQLPNDLIDYVLLHELNHVKHMNHSKLFWNGLADMYGDIKKARSNIKNYQPRLETNLP